VRSCRRKEHLKALEVLSLDANILSKRGKGMSRGEKIKIVLLTYLLACLVVALALVLRRGR